MRAILATGIFCLSALLASVPAEAVHRHHHHGYRVHLHRVAHARHHVRWSHRWQWHHAVRHGGRTANRATMISGSRPRDCYGIPWCGCYLRHLLGVPDRALNLAANWARWGRPAGPQPGAVVVWPHHVGIIRGGPDRRGRWLVESGNDGHAVRTRYRPLAGAIAFRQA